MAPKPTVAPTPPLNTWPLSTLPDQARSTTFGALIHLTKPRLAIASVLSAMTTYVLADPVATPAHALLAALGITLAGAGSLAYNQCREAPYDALMQRTRQRPLPTGRLSPRLAYTWSLTLTLGGCLILATTINLTSALLALATFALYGLLYTPLKRRTPWATEVGALSGALLPLLGAAAAGNVFHPVAWLLATLILFWQMPHFYGIGWKYREDYARGGYRLLPVTDPDGQHTGKRAVAYSLPLIVIPLLAWHLTIISLPTALILATVGLAMTLASRHFLRAGPQRNTAAHQLFLTSLAYLGIVLCSLLADSLG